MHSPHRYLALQTSDENCILLQMKFVSFVVVAVVVVRAIQVQRNNVIPQKQQQQQQYEE